MLMDKSIEVGRRDFLRGSLAVGAGLVSAGMLAGCSPKDKEAPVATSSGSISWDKEVEFLVVGAGGAVWGALAAIEKGATSVMIIEKGELFGGTTALSEGITWIPMNYVMEQDGLEDNREDAIKYIKTVSQGGSNDELIESYVDNAPEFIKWTRDTYNFGWERYYDWINQDYYQVDGYRGRGRAINIDATGAAKEILGEDWVKPEKPSNGQAYELIRYVCEQNNVEIVFGTEGKRLYRDDNGAVIGLLALQADGTELNIKASKGILLGTGGFDFNDDMRREFLRTPFFASRHVTTNTGDGQRMGMAIGAGLANMAAVYGQCCMLPQGEYEGMQRDAAWTITDSYQFRGKPGAVVVNRYGKRIGNESTVYANFQRCMEGWDSPNFKLLNIPAYFICDSEYTKHYKLPSATEIGEIPDWLVVADSLEDLAAKLEIDPAGLVEEITEFNANAANGVDPKFRRGEFSHDQHSVADMTRDDLTNKCLAPVATPPFYGTRYYPASLGTAGGLKINGKAQVLDVEGNVIPGLYACGCCASSPFGAGYVGGGACVGSSSVMAWLAGRDAMGA